MLLGTRMEDVGFAGQVSSVYAVTNLPYRKIHRLRISNRKAQERSSAPVGASYDFYLLLSEIIANQTQISLPSLIYVKS